MRVSCGRWSDEPLAEGNCVSESERGEEAGEQNLDLMNKNRVRRHGAPGKLARGSEAQEGSERLDVNAAGVRGKSWHLIRGGLSCGAGVSRGHSSRWSNDHPWRYGKHTTGRRTLYADLFQSRCTTGRNIPGLRSADMKHRRIKMSTEEPNKSDGAPLYGESRLHGVGGARGRPTPEKE